MPQLVDALIHLIAAKVTNYIDEGGVERPFGTLRQIVSGKSQVAL